MRTQLTAQSAYRPAERLLAEIACRPLFALETPEINSVPIFTPGYDDSCIRGTMTSQFRDDANTYAAAYADESLNRQLLALARPWLPEEVKVVLELCSGGGNNLAPLLEIFPDATVVATDLSPELLSVLSRRAHERGIEDGVVAVQLDASEDLLAPESTDLVIGMAALHHVIEPRAALSAARKALRSGGVAVFYEPLAAGYAFLAHTHRLLLADPRSTQITPDGRSYLDKMALGWEMILDQGKTREAVCGFDDKWCFPRAAMERLAAEAGFASCRFVVPKPVVTFTSQTLRTMPLAIPGAGRDILPDWCWQAFGNMDKLCSGPLFDEMACNALVILQALTQANQE
jgi:SAM-dependent methyltransferase